MGKVIKLSVGFFNLNRELFVNQHQYRYTRLSVQMLLPTPLLPQWSQKELYFPVAGFTSAASVEYTPKLQIVGTSAGEEHE